MKILLITLPRCGSTSLLYKISEEKKLKPISEPFDERRPKFKNIPNNCVIKSIIKQHPTNIKDIIEWYCEFSSNFDDVILLSRKDLKSCWESLSYYTYNEKFGFKSNLEYYWKETPNIQHCKNYILECDKLMNDLSKKLKINIQYYEDIYDIDSNNRLRKGNNADLDRKNFI